MTVQRETQLQNDGMNEKKNEVHREIFPCNQGEYFIIAYYYRLYYSTESL